MVRSAPIPIDFSLKGSSHTLNLRQNEPLSQTPFLKHYRAAQKLHLPAYSIAVVVLKPTTGSNQPNVRFFDSNRLIEAITDKVNVLHIPEGAFAPGTQQVIESVHHFAIPCFRLDKKGTKNVLYRFSKYELPTPLLLTAEKIEVVRGYFAAVNLAYIEEMEAKNPLQRHIAIYKAKRFQNAVKMLMEREGTHALFQAIAGASNDQVSIWKKCSKEEIDEDIASLERAAHMAYLLTHTATFDT
jgi:hypothetical protein